MLSIFNPWTIGSLLISLAMAYHAIRNGKSPLWLMGLAVASFLGFLATVAVWLGYLAFAVIPDMLRSAPARRLADNVVSAADPGRGPHHPRHRVRALAPGGVDAVLDTAGRGALAITQRIGTAGVRAASVANSNEHPGTIQVFAHLDQADLEALVELAEAGKLSVRVTRSFPLDQAADAQRLLAEGHSGGKIVLTAA